MNQEPKSPLQERYVLEEEVARSWSGVVWRGRDRVRGQTVAIKRFDFDAPVLLERRLRFFAQLETLSQAPPHPYVLAVLDFGEDEGCPYVVSEFLPGATALAHREEGSSSLDAVLPIARAIASALDSMHRHGVAHLSLTPSAVLLTPSRTVVTGFGVACLEDLGRLLDAPVGGEGRQQDPTLRFCYLAPEQAGLLRRPVGPAADLYALGVILYELLAGHPPFSGDDPGAVLHDHLARQPAPLEREDLPADLAELVVRLLEKEPHDRPGSAAEVLLRLETLGAPIEATGELRPGELGRTLRREAPLVARDAHRAAMAAVLGRASNSRDGSVLLSGGAGLGKSRLLESLAHLTREAGGRFMVGKCPERASPRPLAPFVDALDEYRLHLRSLPRQGRLRREACLTERCPHAFALDPVAQARAATPFLPGGHVQRNEHYERCVEFLLELAELEPLLVVAIDDLQWADEGTLELFVRLATRSGTNNLVVVGAYRPQEAGSMCVAALERVRTQRSSPLEIELAPLEPEAARQLVQGLLGSQDSATAEIAAAVVERVGGNPLHLQEVLQALVDQEGLVGDAEGWRLDTATLEDAALRAGVTAVIRARAERLGEEAFGALSRAAVIGRSFSLDLLIDVTALRPSRALLALEQAREAGLLQEHGSRLTWNFAHDKVREALEGSLSREALREVHGAVADAVRAENPDRLTAVAAELADHYAASNRTGEALAFELLAGEAAVAAFQLREAARYLSRALDRLDADADPERFARTVALYASARRYMGDYAHVQNLLERALPIGEDLGDPELLLELYGRLALVSELSGLPDARERIQRFMDAAENSPQPHMRVVGTAMLGYHHFDHGEPLKAIPCLEEALAAEGCLEEAEVPTLTSVLGFSYARTGRVDEGLRTMEEAIRLAEQRGAASVGWTSCALGAMHLEWGNWQRGAPYVERARRILEVTGDIFYLVLARASDAIGQVLAGEPKAGLLALEEAIAFGERHGVRSYLQAYRCFGGEAELTLGMLDDGLRHVQEALEGSRAQGDRWIECRAQRVMAEALAGDEARADEAERYARASLAIAEEYGLVPEVGRALRALGTLHDSRGDARAARESWDGAREVFVRCAMDTDLAMLEALAAQGQRSSTRPPEPSQLLTERAPTSTQRGPHSGHDLMHKRGFQTIVQVSRMVGATLDPDRLLDRSLGAAVEVFGAERGVLLVVDGDRLSVRAARGLDPEMFGRGDLEGARTLADAVRRSGRPQPDVRPEDLADRSYLCVPIGAPCRAVLYLENRLVRGLFTAEDTLVLEAIAAQLAVGIENARAYREIARLKERLERENVFLKEELATHAFPEIVGESEPLRRALRRVEQVAPLETTVLLRGETGVGKELFARAIHQHSARGQGPLVRVNCSALTPTLVMSELFGHEQGAFTGATARKLGRFEMAAGGTLFLDEIGDVPLETQLALLRVLCEGEFERVGGTRTLSVDVRVVAATNRDLERAVSEGKFRSDLFYRLNGFTIDVPPLRERKGDVALLATTFALRHAKRLGKPIAEVSPDALESLEGYRWPGNVRELDHVIERAVILSSGSVLTLAEALAPESSPDVSDMVTLAEHERRYLSEVLRRTGWRIKGEDGAARVLGLPPSTLTSRLKKLGVERPEGD